MIEIETDPGAGKAETAALADRIATGIATAKRLRRSANANLDTMQLVRGAPDRRLKGIEE